MGCVKHDAYENKNGLPSGRERKPELRKVGVSLKNKLENMKQDLIRFLPVLVFIYCVLQPLLDVAAYWQTELEISNVVTMALRMGLLAGSVLLGFFLSDRKRWYWLCALVLGAFLAARTAACLEVEYPDPVEDLIYMARIYFLPLTALCFCTFLRKNGRVLWAIQNGMVVNLAIILAVMALGRLTGTDPYTYPSTKIGVQGWFLYGNTQSAILSMIVPVCIGWALKRWDKKILPVVIVTALSLTSLYLFGTRLAFASLAAAGVGMAVCLVWIDKTRRRQAIAILCVTMVFLVLLPLSPMYKNLNQAEENQVKKQSACDELAKENLAEAYALYIPGTITRFGEERTLEAYEYTTEVSELANWRKMRLIFCQMLQEDSPESAKWVGMSVTRMREKVLMMNEKTWEKEIQWLYFDPENDFHGIYYVCGGIGLALMIAFIGFFAFRAVFAMCRDFRRHFTLDFAAMAISCCTALAHCYFTASILRFNSAGVYFAMALASMWYMSRRERSAKRMQGN